MAIDAVKSKSETGRARKRTQTGISSNRPKFRRDSFGNLLQARLPAGKNCRDGKAALEAFCDTYGVPWQRTGKVIVATHPQQLPQLQTIFERGKQNGVDCSVIGVDRLQQLEPHCAGIAAIHVPESGIVDYPGMCQKLGSLLLAANAQIHLNCCVKSIDQRTDFVRLQTSDGDLEASQVINCGGLHSDRIARQSGLKMRERIIPFRGEYFEIKPEAHHLCKTLIYPVPDPRFPFLGVHFTRMIQGGVECGPNAVLALGARRLQLAYDQSPRCL